jgi:hypothetical protein
MAAPDYVSVNFTSHEVQAALGNFFAENPPLPREDRKDYDAEMDSDVF